MSPIQHLGDLHGTSQQRLRQAASGFEAAFMHELMRGMDQPIIDDEPLLGSDAGSQMAKDLQRQQMIDGAAGGLGIADLVVRELSAQTNVIRKH